MAVDVIMPRLSDSMEEGTVLRWMKSVGDEVKRGDELVEIETDKANMTYEATDEGALLEILAEEGSTLPIGEPIARIGEAGEASSNGAPKREQPKQEEESRPRSSSRSQSRSRSRSGAGRDAGARRRRHRPPMATAG